MSCYPYQLRFKSARCSHKNARVRKTVETNGITINFEIEVDDDSHSNHFDGIIFSENLNEMRHSYDF
jgi:hypothetical protein